MEIGSHDRLQEGALSLELANGVNRYCNDDEESMETEQSRAGSAPPRQCWVAGQGKLSGTQQQQPCWNSNSDATPSEPAHHANMEDAHNLVAFSAIAGSLPPSSSSSCLLVQPNTAQLYERFTQEMGAEGAHARISAVTPEGSCQPLEDLNTLQTALSQAKHGHKPPNCNCDGPDCPDYLEWLEKKIKLATNEDQGASKMAEASPHLQPHLQQPLLQHRSYPQVNGGPHLHTSFSQQQQGTQGPHRDQVPCSKPPIPCSPQVLSIAKEKNISLQTAIAIEALTQLSGTSPQAIVSPGQTPYNSNLHHQHTQNLTSQPSNGSILIPPSPGTHSSSSRSQSVPPGLHTSQQASVSCEHHRPQSQGQPPHATPLPSSTSPFPSQGKPVGFSPNPQQWQQSSGRGSEQRKPWMCVKSETQSHFAAAPHSSSDPMSELKQLLGDTSGKFSNSSFKLPVTQQLSLNQNGGILAQDSPALPRVKQEPDSGEHYHHTASMGHYGMANGPQQGQHYPGTPLSPGQAAISHSTQAALQQHLHYKRNLFSNHSPGFGTPGPRPPLACQNLKKWWPQIEADVLPHLAIKQESKEPKKKKSTQGSPIIKAISGMHTGPPLPKPKQIIIKKTKQKPSMPTFLPQTQISIQKPTVLITDRAPAPTSLPSLPLHSNSTQAAAAGLSAPAQSQVSISTSSVTPSSTVSALSANTPALTGPLLPAVAPVAHAKSEGTGSPATSNTSTTIPLTSTFPSSTSQLSSLVNLDPKYEELIRQFEAEFGDSAPDASGIQSMEATATVPQLGNQSQTIPQDLSPTSSSASQSAPLCLSTQASSAPHPNDQEMEVNKDESGTQIEATLNKESTKSPVKEQYDGPHHVSLPQEAVQQQPSVLKENFSMPCSLMPKRMKLEASGDMAILSTTCFSEEDTPTKDSLPSSPSLRGFLESPLRYLDTPTKSLLDTPSKNLQSEFPLCTCVEQILEKDEGPYYNHLGSGPTVASIRNLMESRYGEKGDAIRIEKVVYTGKEGKSSQGCPIAKWVIRRSSETEKLLCLVRQRAGHHCAHAVIIILIMAWEGVPKMLADKLYRELSDTLTKYGNPTSRRCGLNDDRTCACQGKDPESCGASFSFGCSWSMYFNGCKYARSKLPRKFRLQGDHPEEEDKLRDNFQHLATEVAPLYKQLAPQAYSNQCQSESRAPECRLGLKEGRPFSGVTACMDFCAHAHKDQHNLHNGCTVVCTLTKEDNRAVGEIPEDEQLHVLPLYKISPTDEFGSEEAQNLKMQTGAIQVLQAFRREVRKLPEPAKSCRQRRLEAKKAASEKKKSKLLQQAVETPEKAVVKTELCVTGSPQLQGNKAIIKQEMKPNIKKEPFNGYPVQAADPFNNIYPHPAYYARGGLPPTGQPSAPDPINGCHPPPNLPTVHYSYYSYPPNALFPPKLRTYEGRNGSSPKAGGKAVQVDKKPDIQSLQARLAQSYPSQPEQTNQPNHSAYAQPADYTLSRPSSVSSETSNRGTPVIKQEPIDAPINEGAVPSQARANTPSTIPQPTAWPGHKFNGNVLPTNWENHRNHKQNPDASSLNPEKQQFHQHPQQRSSPYPTQWTSYPGSNVLMTSPALSPSLQVPPSPSPSPHPGAALLGNVYQGATCPATPRPSTPHPGTPQPRTSHSGSVTPQPGTPGPGTPRHWSSPAPSPQPNAWAMGPAAYSPGLKHSNPAGAYPDKMWSKTGESRCSTPLGLQEKVWKSCGGSVAGSTPSPAPEGRLFPDALQQSDQACWDPRRAESDVDSIKGREEEEDEVWSDSEHNFLDPNIGGVAVAPAHGSILIECARRELHATTPLKKPNRSHPTRISLVFYQHKNLNQPMHGLALWEAKMKLLAERALQRQQEAALLGLSQEDIKALGKKRKWGATAAGASPGPGQSKDRREGPVTRVASTFHTTSMVTVSPYAFTRLTGPYSHFV
ncbi:methylcytosine dioxygenase TET3 isoform X2 [Echeneis naucrates]|uniref:Methylcytosine dioxygenase TET n=2 Tax=Echeneis naucrates TaxID=173247 RepID=A0A665X000_ECHNA|nr:methylcytosine dioxygenase TET3-like isoform X2 [Echeneis naucrates]XP_029366038.1 methylcytosine dioxygenase TET3-like isoform X2 [Echeneis naucrates]XP_029366039.1 methylcytosine dioxygenase TET3-like isoform X2 [Echeneis naucrates]XP_029366041.1 methylcytosine dioxygenase TET3-like isoform X2 [Echeneis naucrates]XP_029366042.1 methylcytosine dioxygenase TET3-like isoform X2 [Echeneis naucrates]